MKNTKIILKRSLKKKQERTFKLKKSLQSNLGLLTLEYVEKQFEDKLESLKVCIMTSSESEYTKAAKTLC